MCTSFWQRGVYFRAFICGNFFEFVGVGESGDVMSKGFGYRFSNFA